MVPPVWKSPSKNSSISSLSDNIVRRTCLTSDDVGSSSVFVFSAFKLAKKGASVSCMARNFCFFTATCLFLANNSKFSVIVDANSLIVIFGRVSHSQDFGLMRRKTVFVWPWVSHRIRPQEVGWEMVEKVHSFRAFCC